MPSFCAVQSCDDKYGHAENISFHKFPFKRQELMQKWLEFAQRGPDWQPSRWSAVCSRHFRDEDFTCSTDRKILRKTAVPCVQANKVDPDLASKNLQTEQSSVKETALEETKQKAADGKASSVDLPEEVCEGVEAEEENQTPVGPLLQNSPTAPKIKCRLCGSVCSSVVSFSTNFEIYGMIQKCFPTLNIQKDDHLPKEMCRVCLKRLESFSHFIDKVLETQSELQRKYRLEKANTNTRTTERQLKVKQEPVVRVKQEVAEGLESFLSDDLDMAVDESCEQDAEVETNVEQKYDFCDFPMLNAQDIINNCDIMEIINLDDPFIDIPDDDANTNCETGTAEPPEQAQRERQETYEQPQQMDKPAFPSAHELLQAHLLSEEHNYAYAAAEDMKEEWQSRHIYKTEKTEGGELGDDVEEFITNAETEEEEQVVYAGEQEHNTEESDETRVDVYKENYPTTTLMATTNLESNKLQTTSTASVSSSEETRSARPIVTSVSELADASVALPNTSSTAEHVHREKLMVTEVNNLSAPNTSSGTSAITDSTSAAPSVPATKPHTKPNIVVLNESIVKSSSAFQLHTCHYCHLKFFSGESLNQHYIVAHQMQPQLGQTQQKLQPEQMQQQHQQQLHLPHSFNQQEHTLMTQNQYYQQQQHQQQELQQAQIPMVSVPAEYLWKPYGMSNGSGDETLNLNCKIEKGYGSPNTRADGAYQQTNMYAQTFDFAHGTNARDVLVTQNCNSNTKDNMNGPNAVQILDMKRTFLRHHEPYSNGGIVNASCAYDKMPTNGVDNSFRSTNFCAINVARMEENQMRNITPAQPMSISPRLIETKRTKQSMRINKKIIARLKALERKLNKTAAPKLIAAEYRKMRRHYTMLQLKCKRLELQIKEKHPIDLRAETKTTRVTKQQRRQLKEKSKTRFSCRVCQRAQFKNIYQLLRHKRLRAHWTRRMPKRFAATCSGCEKFFRHKLALHNHMRYICQALPLCWFKTQMKTFKCRICRRSTFNHWRLYRRHEVKCKARKQRLKNASVRRRAKTKQKVADKMIAAPRTKSLSDASTKSLGEALTRSVNDNAPIKSVSDTPKTSNVNAPPCILRELKPSAAATRTYPCTLCAKVFPSPRHLRQHHITHTDQRLHKCELCGRAFKRRNGLTQHVRAFHLHLKPHKCTVCQRAFALKSDMLRCRHVFKGMAVPCSN